MHVGHHSGTSLCRPADARPLTGCLARPASRACAGDKGVPAWKFNKRDYYAAPIPRGLPELPLNAKNEIVSGAGGRGWACGWRVC